MRSIGVVRSVTLSVTILAVAMGTSACGGDDGVDKATLTSKIKAEKDFKDVPASFIDCMADVTLKYADKKSLQDYVDGKVKLDDVKGLGEDNKAGSAEAEKCVQAAK